MMAAVIAVVMSTLGRRELRARQLSEAAAKAQAYALQAQINPHFFFNTLNTISALVPTDGPAAQRMIGRLAEMFRYTLASSHGDLVPLEREIEFVRNYLELEKERYRQRLEFTLPSAQEVKGIQVPGLTLQPLVENAIRYGIAKRMEGGQVSVEVRRRGETVIVSVLNQTDGAVTVEERPGHALANVRERLRLAFGEAAKMNWSMPSANWIEVRVQVPAG